MRSKKEFSKNKPELGQPTLKKYLKQLEEGEYLLLAQKMKTGSN